MFVKQVHAKQFRNYSAADIAFSPGVNIILGRNGQGKTNLLEMLYFLSHAKSNRTSSDRELIMAEKEEALVSATVFSHLHQAETVVSATLSIANDRLKTRFKHHVNVLRSRSEVLGLLPSVSFFLPDLLLLRGAPADRRQWLDLLVSQYDKRHLNYCNTFQKIRQQKSMLLKQGMGSYAPDYLRTWNMQFTEAATVLTVSRLRGLSMVYPLIKSNHQTLSNGDENLELGYQSKWLPVDSDPQNSNNYGVRSGELLDEAVIKDILSAALESHLNLEMQRGVCLVGPHRDDIVFSLNTMLATAYASQGQQRTIVLALKLSEMALLRQKLMEPPVLLLDDVMAELDDERQRLLVNQLHPTSQVILTTTHPSQSWQAVLEDNVLVAQHVKTQDELAVFGVERGNVSAVVKAAV
ncbi:MAG: DNA replication/repair protein RecF [Cyanobacteria bacterium P01_H01_bin.74]